MSGSVVRKRRNNGKGRGNQNPAGKGDAQRLVHPPLALTAKRGVEVKSKCTYSAAAAVLSAAPVFTDCCVIAQGSGRTSRVGDEIEVVKVAFRMKADATGSTTDCVVRLMGIFWYTPDGVNNPNSLVQFLNSVSGTVSAADYTIAAYNPTSVQQQLFGVLFDRTFPINAGALSAVWNQSWDVKQRVAYDLGGVTTGQGKFYVIAFSDAFISTATLSWTCDILYEDS